MKIRLTSIHLLLALLLVTVAKAQFINTFAGNGIQGFLGDGGSCGAAELNNCSAVAFDGAGNVYIADMGNNMVRKVNTSGIISTIAGNGSAGFGGDGSLAAYGILNAPSGVAVDAAGNIYIADKGNNRIRKISTLGIISTYAGTGVAGYSGDGAAAKNAKLNGPIGLAVDRLGDLYIADAGNNAIRKIYASGNITTLAGGGAAGYSGDAGFANYARLSNPTAIAIDPRGQIFIADNANSVIRVIDTNYVMHTFAGNGYPGYSGDGGPALAASVFYPTGVAVYGFGDVYIADQGNSRIRHINSAGNISTFAGNGTNGYFGDGGYAVNAKLRSPVAVAADGDNRVYIADQGNNVIRRVSDMVAVKPVVLGATSFKVYPNPSNGSFSVDVPAIGSASTITIMDITGRVITTAQIDATNQASTLHFNNIKPGSYILRLEGPNGAYHERLEVW